MYAEDMDLCYRLRARGHEIGFCPRSRVRHLGNASGARLWRERREAAVIRSQLRFLRLHRGLASDLGFRALALPFYLGRMTALGVQAALASAARAGEHRAAARECLYSLRVLAGGGGGLPPDGP
jgi:GT2 family glycosyltransferase